MKCGTCEINEEINKKRNICGSCYAKDYRKRNPNSCKDYYQRNKEKRQEQGRENYRKNMERCKEYNKNYKYTENYKKLHNSKEMKELHGIRLKTRLKYPLEGKRCSNCPKDAEHRHHTTNPPEVDKFKFLCHGCHMKVHNRTSHRDAVFLGESEQ